MEVLLILLEALEALEMEAHLILLEALEETLEMEVHLILLEALEEALEMEVHLISLETQEEALEMEVHRILLEALEETLETEAHLTSYFLGTIKTNPQHLIRVGNNFELKIYFFSSKAITAFWNNKKPQFSNQGTRRVRNYKSTE